MANISCVPFHFETRFTDSGYIDCTWDDPVGGGYENYKYYLSESLWSDHIAETAKDLSEDGKYDWEHYYLTGADYAR